MREAMAWAEVGDEQEREDPTVLELERRVAALLGHEEAVYLPTATMGNQIALSILGERGTELVVEETAHIMVSRARRCGRLLGAADARASRLPRTADARTSCAATTHADGSFHTPRTSVVALENTHNTAGGTVWPLDELRAVVEVARGAPDQRPPRRCPAAQRGGRSAGRPGGDRRAVRHGDALPLEGARLPTRRPDRRLAPS